MACMQSITDANFEKATAGAYAAVMFSTST